MNCFNQLRFNNDDDNDNDKDIDGNSCDINGGQGNMLL